MALFTLVIEFRGGTYVKQVKGSSPSDACRELTEQIKTSGFLEVGPSDKQSFINEIMDESPVPLDDTINTWCVTALLNDNLVLINIIQTER